MDIDLSQFHQVFFEESLEGLDVMEQELLQLEEDSDIESINNIFRVVHSIKGGSATFHFEEVASFTHILETLLDEMRDGKRSISQNIISLLLESVDCLRNMIDSNQNGNPVEDSYQVLTQKFNQLLSGNEEKADELNASVYEQTPSTTHADQISNLPEINDLSEVDDNKWLIEFAPQYYILETGNEPFRLFRELSLLGSVEIIANVEKVPSFSKLKPENCYLSWTIILDAEIDELTIREVFEWVEADCELHISRCNEKQEAINFSNQAIEQQNVDYDALPQKKNTIKEEEAFINELMSIGMTASEESDIATEESSSDNISSSLNNPVADISQIQPVESPLTDKKLITLEENNNKSKITKTAPSSSIRVSTDKVDGLIDLVGELVITQSMLSELGEDFNISKLTQLISGLSDLEQNTRELQESIMRIRMLPIGFVFNRMPRMVRDLSAKLGKKACIDICGESTELDKTVMEQIGDPLTHLVRNALDHGLESTEERIAMGKSEEGLITLNAYHQGGHILIEISDDGAGINPEIIYQKAIEKGLIGEGVDIPAEQILSLIMEPGFSTADVVSDVSGRGVGLDVVKRNINNLGGSVEIYSELGIGTQFTIRLPLTLAILDGQLISVANEIYVLPLVSIIESIPIMSNDILRVAGNMPVYKFNNEYIPIVDLVDEFDLQTDHENIHQSLLVIIEGENRKIALKIDQLLGQQQVVIKSLETHYKFIKGISGATILGNGKVSLILDVVGLAKRAAESSNEKSDEVA